MTVIVAGAGPAGLMAAIGAAEAGALVVVLEKHRAAGRKLLLTAGGRCNVSHAGPVADLLECYGGHGRFLRPALYAFSNAHLAAFFSERGLGLVQEEGGRLYPHTMRSTDVRRVLLEECRRLGVAVRYEEPALAVERAGDALSVSTAGGVNAADSVIVAAGGSSYPATGSTGDGCAMCRGLGHTITPLAPALAPVVLRAHPFAACAGVAVAGARVTAARGGRRVAEGEGELLFTHRGVSGPVVIDLSRSLAPGDELRLGFVAGPVERVDGNLAAAAAAHGGRTVAGCLDRRGVPGSVLDRVLAACAIPANLRAGDLDRRRRRLLAERLVAFPVDVERLAGWDEAMVTRGGVSLDEIDPSTMESRVVPGLYVAGETLDVDGASGGYNLQAAFSTGMLAGRSAARRSRGGASC
jgi:predicted Rossmann fold flavoprotein